MHPIDQAILWLVSAKGAGLVAVLFFALWFWRGRGPQASRAVAVAAALWVAYACYEVSLDVFKRKGGEPIRVDLLLMVPILAIASLLAIFSVVRRAWRSNARR